MDNSTQRTNQSSQVDFLKAVIDSAEKRRDAVENKASILIAANAILFTATVGFIAPAVMASASGSSTVFLINTGLTFCVLVAIIVSIVSATSILVSISTDKQRQKVMDIESEFNLFYFGKIAERKKDEYRSLIESLTDEQILEQYVAEAHNLSRILKLRYRSLYRAHGTFVIAVIAFALLALSKALGS